MNKVSIAKNQKIDFVLKMLYDLEDIKQEVEGFGEVG